MPRICVWKTVRRFTPKAISVSATGIEEEKRLDATFFCVCYIPTCLYTVCQCRLWFSREFPTN